MSDVICRNTVNALKGELPDWKCFFEKALMFEIDKEDVTALVRRLNQNTKNNYTVWSNVIPDYPEIRPVTVEQIHEIEKYMYEYAKPGKSFDLTLQQIEYMTGKPTLFDRQQGATTAFILLVLMQKGQPLFVEADPRVLSYNEGDNGCVLFHYTDYREFDFDRNRKELFTRQLLNTAKHIIQSGGGDFIRDVIVIRNGAKPTSLKSVGGSSTYTIKQDF